MTRFRWDCLRSFGRRRVKGYEIIYKLNIHEVARFYFTDNIAVTMGHANGKIHSP